MNCTKCKRLLLQQVNGIMVADGMHRNPGEADCVAEAQSVSIFWSESEINSVNIFFNDEMYSGCNRKFTAGWSHLWLGILA